MRFRARCAAVVVGAAALASGVGSAGAHDVSYKSTIEIRDVYDSAQAIGTVASPNAKCLPNRTVEIYAVKDTGPQLVDVDPTSRRGYWSGGGATLTQGASAVRVKVLSRNVGPKGHTHVCQADTAVRQAE